MTVFHSNSRFNALETIFLIVHSFTMPVGFGGVGIKRKGRPLVSMVQLKISIVELGAEENSLAHALLRMIVRLNNPNYKAYRQDRNKRPAVRQLFGTTGIDLKNGARIPELN